MTSSPTTLAQLIDDELARAALLIDQLVASMESPRAFDGAQSIDPRSARDLQAALVGQRGDMVKRFCASLREQLGREAAGGPSRKPAALALSLVDDEEVTTDVELSRTVEAIASVAEYELRELRAFTSAMVGDMAVARDTNPLGPEVYARALWAAAGVLPLSRGFRVAFMRQAAMPLAKALRTAYAAACTRLEDAGVQPGMYRTLILPAGTRKRRPGDEAPPPDLPKLRDSMPMPLDEHAPTPTRAAAPRVDQQLVELLTRLFDAMLADRHIPAAVRLLMSRLQSSALRVALRDPRMLESYDHPVWRFMDQLAFSAEQHPNEDDPLRRKLLDYAQGLVDDLTSEATQDVARFDWGLQRLLALDRHFFEQRRRDAAEQIAALQAMNSAAVPLDVGTLDTVPAELLDLKRAAALPAAQPAQNDGAWARVFLKGEWQRVQLLWHDETLWLFAAVGRPHTWALRSTALDRLQAEGLMQPLAPRSLVRRAADLVLRQVTGAAERR